VPDRRRDNHRVAARLTGSVPGSDHTVKLQNLLFQPSQLSSECQETRAGYLRDSLVVGIGDDLQQFLDTIAADRRDNPKLGKMGL
jgi:hypothetical protein